jgi:hypothetical protein
MTQHVGERASEPEMTLAQWADMDEDEPGELVDGRLIEEEEAGGRYVKAVGAGEGIVEKVPGCEGLTLDLDALWGEASRLEAE